MKFFDKVMHESVEKDQRLKADLQAAIENITQQAKWLFLDEKGPRLHPIISFDTNNFITRPYFFYIKGKLSTILDYQFESIEENPMDGWLSENGRDIFMCNGWTMGHNEDISHPESHVII